MSPDDVLQFWFDGPADDAVHVAKRFDVWFKADAAFDARVRERFAPVLDRAAGGEFDHWTSSARGRLALIVVFDQFPRNIHRGTPRAYATDDLALALCRRGIELGQDLELAPYERVFFYIPFEHAEDLEAQDRCAFYYRQLHETASPEFRDIFLAGVRESAAHRDVIRRFGRFPHRNAILGRASTHEEMEWYAANRGGWGQGDPG